MTHSLDMHTKSEVEGNKVRNNKDWKKKQRERGRRKGNTVESSLRGLRKKRGCFSLFPLYYPHSFIT